jgi:hypothetical protein
MRDSGGGAAVAKRRRNAETKPAANSRRLSVQASEEWISWVEDFAEFHRIDVSKLVDVSLASYARSSGFPKPPPKRVP